MKLAHVIASLTTSVLVSLLAPSASGQAPAAVRTPRYIEGDWRFVADWDGQAVRSVLVWHPPSSLVGNNLGVVWFVKNTDRTWSGWTWPAPDVGVAVCSIRSMPGFSNAFANQPDLNEKALVCQAATPPDAMEKGLLATDPLQPVLSSVLDPAALVQTLTNAGWQAAPLLGELMAETRAVCINIHPIDDILNAVEYRTLTDIGEVIPADLVRCRAGWWPCEGCEYTYTGVTPTGPWVLDSSHCINGTRRCVYSRPATAATRTTSRESLICFSCRANGTPVTGHLTGSAQVPCTDQCPPLPSGEGEFVED